MGELINPDPKYWLKKRANRRTGFPLATIAYYGADDRQSSKVVVGIFENGDAEEPATVRKWFASDGDIRSNIDFHRQIVEFLQEHKVERVAMADRIIGCPHEEGVDYSLGGKCPECPFWANRDRFTGELI